MNNTLNLDEKSQRIDITSEGVFNQYYSSEIDQVCEQFKNTKYLQEISLDGTRLKYQNDQFEYPFSLQSKQLYYTPKLNELFDMQQFENSKPNPICIASTKQIIAIAYIDYIQIWNQKKERICQLNNVCCMDFTNDGDILICGCNKNIVFINTQKGIIFQQFQNIHIQRLLVLKCLYYNSNDDVIITTSIDVAGYSQIISFKKTFINFTPTQSELLDTMQFPTGSMKYYTLGQKSFLLAVNSIEFFWLLKIEIQGEEFTKTIIKEIKNPRKVKDSQIFKTSCALGRGLINIDEKQQQQIIILYSWDIRLYHLIYDIETNSIIQIKPITLINTIYELSFLKNSLYLIQMEKSVVLMNSIDIDISQTEIHIFSIRHHIQTQIPLILKGQQVRKCKTIMKNIVQKYVKIKLNNEEIINYSQQFTQNMIISNNKCIQASIVNASALIKQILSKDELVYAMNFILNLLKLYNLYFNELLELTIEERYSLLRYNVEEVTFKYLKICINLINYNNSLMNNASKYIQQDLQYNNQLILCLLIEFLLECGAYDLLFIRVMGDINYQLKDNHSFFLHCLQPFYSKKLVRDMPSMILQQIVEIYDKMGRIDLLQLLIQSLDHKKSPSDQLIKICLKYGLIKSLAIITATSDIETQLMPIFQIWSAILLMIQKNNFETASYFTLRILALSKMIYDNYNILGENVQSIELKKRITQWLLTEIIIERLLTFQSISTFEIILKILEYQKTNDENSFNKTILLVSKVISIIQAGNNEFQQEFQKNENSPQFTDDLKIQFQFFQTRCYLLFGGHKQRIINHLNYMLKNPITFQFIYFQELIESIKDNIQMQQLVSNWEYKKDIIEFLKCQYFINIVKKLEIGADEQDMKDILNLGYEAEFTTLSIISIHLSIKKKEYSRAFDFYLTSHNQFVRSLVFDWFSNEMKILQDNDIRNYEIMKSQLILKISDLIQIDWNKTRIIFSNYNSESENIVIDKLQQFPELQLQYVENVIRRERELNHEVEDQLLILHITLLSQLNPDKIIDEVKNHNYPLEFILEPCKQQETLKPQAYILERMGRTTEAVKIYCDLLRQIIQKHKGELDQNYKLSTKLGGSDDHSKNLKVFFPLAKKLKDQNELNFMKPFEDAKKSAIDEIVEEIQKIIQVCKSDNNKLDQSDEKWYTFLDQLIDIRDNLIYNGPSQQFMKTEIFTTQICHIFATIAEVSNFDTLLFQLQNRYNKLDLGQLKKTFDEIIQNYLYIQHLQSNAQTLVVKDIYEKLRIQIQKQKHGIFGNQLCYKNRHETALDQNCNVNNDDLVIFECHHSYHKKCAILQQGMALCNICSKKDQKYTYQIFSMNSKIELNAEGDPSILEDEMLKEEIQNVEDFQQTSAGTDEVQFIASVSQETMNKRKRRTQKLYYWDRKRMENFTIMEETNKDIDYFNKQKEMLEKKKEVEESQARKKKLK